MSVSVSVEPAEADSSREAHALAFRIAFATAIGFTLGQVLGWDFPFLPALFAAQLLTASRSLNLKQAVGFRNIAVHQYRDIDWAIVHGIARDRLGDFEEFARAVLDALKR